MKLTGRKCLYFRLKKVFIDWFIIRHRFLSITANVTSATGVPLHNLYRKPISSTWPSWCEHMYTNHVSDGCVLSVLNPADGTPSTSIKLFPTLSYVYIVVGQEWQYPRRSVLLWPLNELLQEVASRIRKLVKGCRPSLTPLNLCPRTHTLRNRRGNFFYELFFENYHHSRLLVFIHGTWDRL